MGKILEPKSVKLFCGFIYNNLDVLQKSQNILIENFGVIDIESKEIDFVYTDYYNKEMGSKLFRKFVSFENLIDPSKLSSIKILTNQIESKFLNIENRNVNIDPGYLDSAKVILASTKDFSHRIYIGDGIYAEITLSFKAKKYSFLPWTYPDYQTEDYLSFFYKVREKYRMQINNY